MEMSLVENLVTKEVFIISAAIVVILFFVNKIPISENQLGNIPIWRKILPILPLILGITFAFIPGIFPNGISIADKILTGIWSGLIGAHGRKAFKRILIDKLGVENGKKENQKD